MRVLMAGGGTGGHLFPAIAIAREIARLDPSGKVAFVGTRYGLEYRMKDELGFPLSCIAMRGLARTLSPSLLLFPLRLLLSVWQALRLCVRFRPDIVVGTGGYVSAPVLIAAMLKKIPRAMQEQNSYPGLVTRKLASHAQVVFLAYHKACTYLPPGGAYRLAGNPVRRDITGGDRDAAMAKFGLKPGRRTIIVLGGSLGARRLNEAVLAGIGALPDSVQILWQCGKRDYTDVAARLNKMEVAVSLFPFCFEMELVYAAADLAIARAGALTIAELTACGVPALLVPFPYAAADHQTHNAAEVAAAGAAMVISEADLTDTDIVKTAADLVLSDRLPTMAAAARALGRPDAAAAIARDILDLATAKGAMRDPRNAGQNH